MQINLVDKKEVPKLPLANGETNLTGKFDVFYSAVDNAFFIDTRAIRIKVDLMDIVKEAFIALTDAIPVAGCTGASTCPYREINKCLLTEKEILDSEKLPCILDN